MADKCLDLKMVLKSEMTAIMYADDNINKIIHNKIYEWYNIIMNSIYTNPQIKTLIFDFLKMKQIIMPDNLENLQKFINDTLSMTDLSDEQKMTRQNKIIETFDLYGTTKNPANLFLNSSVFDLFFIIYLKGGMATRFICMLLNTLSEGNMFSIEIQKEQLGAISDYDFNCIINPTFERNVYEKFYTTLKEHLVNVLGQLTKDPFFNDPFIKSNLINDASKTASKFPILSASGCKPITDETLGFSSSMEFPGKFGLVRLMARVQIRCSGAICFKDDDGTAKRNTPINGELIDISFPLFDNLGERNHAWVYANKAVSMKWCSVEHNSCRKLLNEDEKYNLTDKIRVYSLHSAIDDLTNTIRETTLRGDTTKIEKRKKRLDFFQKLICQYTLLVNNNDTNVKLSDLNKYCVEYVEGLLCGNDYIDQDTSLILAQFSLGLTQDNNLIFGIVNKYIEYIIGSTNNPIDYKSQLLVTFSRDYNHFLIASNEEQRKSIKPLLCSLLINTISLKKSLNDNFIQAYIGFLFLSKVSLLWSNLPAFSNEVHNFNKVLISSMEIINNSVTRPIINTYFKTIIQNIWVLLNTHHKADEKVQFLIRGGCASHLNIIQNILITKTNEQEMNTNDIDLYINVDRFDQQFLISLNNFFNQINIDLNRKFPGYDIKFEYVMLTSTLYQVIIDYANILPDKSVIITSAGQVSFNNLIPRIRHHIIEINFTNIPTLYDNNQVVPLFDSVGNHQCVFYNTEYLIKEYNKILLGSEHWYRKSKYLRRIAALNGVITEYPVRQLYESEFPLPC